MHKTLRITVRLAVLVAVTAALRLSAGVIGTTGTPYSSALSNISVGETYAAAGCSYRNCQFRGERLYCVSTTIFSKCAQKGTSCTQTPC